MRDKSDLYYEAHVTIEPPTAMNGMDILKRLSALHGYKVSEFAMLPGGQDPDQAKTFTSARGESYSCVVVDLRAFVKELINYNFNVLRYKIEDTIIDSNRHDVLGLIKRR